MGEFRLLVLWMGWLTLVAGFVVGRPGVITTGEKQDSCVSGCEGWRDQLHTVELPKAVYTIPANGATFATVRRPSSATLLQDLPAATPSRNIPTSEGLYTGQTSHCRDTSSSETSGNRPTSTKTEVVNLTRTHTTTFTKHPSSHTSVPKVALESTGDSSRPVVSSDCVSANPTKTTIETSESSSAKSDLAVPTSTMAAHDIFANPIDTKSPPSNMKRRDDHPVPRKGIASQGPLQTNKFFANFQLGKQRAPTYTFPYSIAWAGGEGDSHSWGLSVHHVNASERVFGAPGQTGASKFYFNPVGIQSLVLSAADLGNDTVLTTDSITPFSARVLLSKDAKTQPAVTFPIMQGMPYVTGLYNGAIPKIESGIRFRTVTKVNSFPKPNVSKFNFTLEDGSVWRMYAHRTKGDELELDILNNQITQSKKPFFGSIQLSKDPLSSGAEKLLDDGAGVYPVSMKLSGSAEEDKANYTFEFERRGHDQGELYMYALPHHVESFDEETTGRVLKAKLQTTVKGQGTLVKGTKWTMVEKLPKDMGLAPWHPEKGSMTKISDHAKGLIGGSARHELSKPMQRETDLDSMYFAGKALAKFATLLYVANDLIGDKGLVQDKLGELKSCFGQFAANQQKFPLVYESKSSMIPQKDWMMLTRIGAWGGVASSATYETGNNLSDFGNTYYNDHHFHYGYHILAAATIAHLDPAWLKDNKDYVNTLVRDIANPSAKDKHFPMWRSFDWYHGHSWAHGLFESYDGKNQESSSEDTMHAYALKMWGQVSGDKDLEARSNLQLAILARSLGQYYLYQDDNKVQPKEILGNRVAGILFENKIDHATFFSGDIQAIQGIHMIPILAPTPFIRTSKFVQEEWKSFFDSGRVDKLGDAWMGIIYANYATVDAKKSWDFFSSDKFDMQWIDGGASRTWFMAYAAAMGEL